MTRYLVPVREEPEKSHTRAARFLGIIWSVICWTVAFGSVFVIYALLR